MAENEALHDLATRTRQLEAHLLRSPEYLFKADQGLKRQVSMLYLAIALLLIFQFLFAVSERHHMPLSVMALIVITSFLAIINCLLLIQTKKNLRQLNESWLKPEEKQAIAQLRSQQKEARQRSATASLPKGR